MPLGPEAVAPVFLPSRHTSKASGEDARAVAAALKTPLRELPLEPLHAAASEAMAPLWGGAMEPEAPSPAEENLQSRLRGALLMTLANHEGALLLATGNKSEYAVGYATLYGDTCGAYAPIQDLYKTGVYALARWRNEAEARMTGGTIFSERLLAKPPSAELRPDQRDEDSLPPYDQLDAALHALLEERHTPAQAIAAGHAREVVAFAVRALCLFEYKRRQAPPGPRLSSCAFTRERRIPILHGFDALASDAAAAPDAKTSGSA